MEAERCTREGGGWYIYPGGGTYYIPREEGIYTSFSSFLLTLGDYMGF